MNNSKVREIIKFSFYKNIQNKWFVVFNIITLISIITIINWGSISDILKTNDDVESFEIAVLDNSGLVYADFLNKLSGDERYVIQKISDNNYTAENIPDDLMVVEIIPDEKEIFKTSIISKEGIDVDIYNPVVNELFVIRNKLFIAKYGISNENLETLQSD